jgi:hypothetical protein
MTKPSGLVTPGGEPIVAAADGGQPLKQPPAEALAFLCDLADTLLELESKAFEMQPGTVRQKLQAAHNSELVLRRRLTREQEVRMSVQIGPHLFAKVRKVAVHPALSECFLKTHEVRAGFDAMTRNGYAGVPILGLSPADVLEQAEYDTKELKALRANQALKKSKEGKT